VTSDASTLQPGRPAGRPPERLLARWVQEWAAMGPKYLPFADAATAELPLPRLLRLALFQVSVGMATVLLTGTLNRVMIVELRVPAWLVGLMVGLPLLFAPFRALIGFRSDTHRSALGWRRVPFIWGGTLLQWGGLAIMPFSLFILSGDTTGPLWLGKVAAALAFLLVGAGLHTTQTAGLALATDLAPEDARPRVVALLYVMLLAGLVVSALVFGALLTDFTQIKLIQVIQGAAVVTMVLNATALWQQEARDPGRYLREPEHQRSFREAWGLFARSGRAVRFLVATALGTAAFSMQDVLLEPYGGEILGLSVGATTGLTAILAGGTLVAFALGARLLKGGTDPLRLAGLGALVGLPAFAAVIFAAPLEVPLLFAVGAGLIGFGGGLYGVGTLTAAMAMETGGLTGLALGAWGAAQATAAGTAVALGGVLRDVVNGLATSGALGGTLVTPATGYTVVYQLEIILLFAALVAIGPLVGTIGRDSPATAGAFGLAEFPG
jgi:BCD family chlorophyll transporter-like MFS transporter